MWDAEEGGSTVAESGRVDIISQVNKKKVAWNTKANSKRPTLTMATTNKLQKPNPSLIADHDNRPHPAHNRSVSSPSQSSLTKDPREVVGSSLQHSKTPKTATTKKLVKPRHSGILPQKMGQESGQTSSLDTAHDTAAARDAFRAGLNGK